MANVRGTDGTAVIWCHKGKTIGDELSWVDPSYYDKSRVGAALKVVYSQSSQNTQNGLPVVYLNQNNHWEGMGGGLATKSPVTLPAVSVPTLGSFASSGITFSGTIAPGMTQEYDYSYNDGSYIFRGTATTAGVFNYTIINTQQVKNWRGTVQSEWITYFPVEFHIYANSYLNQNANGGRFPDQSTVITQTVDGYTAPTYTITTTAPTRAGYTFLGWSTSSTATTPSYYGGGSYTGVLDGTSTLYAVWSLNTYNVSLTAGTGGSVSGGGTYNYGSTANISATPNAHYHFTNWSDGNTNASRTFMVSANVTLTAYFAADTHTVTLTAGTGGTVSGGGTYNYGSTANISATPNSGYKFVQWSDGNTSASRSLTVTGDVSLSASFEPAIATTNVKVNGAWTQGSVYIKVNGSWVESKKIYVKVNGNWVEGS